MRALTPLDATKPIGQIEQHVVQQLLSPAAWAQYLKGDVGHNELRPFIQELKRLSDAYTQHSVGTKLPQLIKSELSAQAYALYYLAVNAAKMLHLTPHITSNKETLRVLDFGSGPGTASLALLASLKQPLNITCVESSQPMRAVAKKLLSSWNAGKSLADLSFVSHLPTSNTASYDVIVAANALAELSEAESQALITHLTSMVAPDGFLILLEPGQQLHSRRLMRFRDGLAKTSPKLTPLFPCTRADICPMLKASETDWCHSTIEWAQPKLSRQLDAMLSFNKHRIKFCAFVFQHGGQLRPGMRVITPPFKMLRGTAVTLCGEGLYSVVLIKKGQRSEGTRALEKAAVHDRLLFSQRPTKELPKSITVTPLPL